jgi:putative ABC transport system permease protein
MRRRLAQGPRKNPNMMDLRETVSVAIDALRANKLRAMLTSLGVIIGSASIVLVVTVALTSQKFVISQIEAVGSNLISASLVQSPDKAQPLNYELGKGDLEAAKATIANVSLVAGLRELPMTVVVGGTVRPVNLVGVTDGYQQIRHLVILRGRYFDGQDVESRSKVCLVTKDLADRVYGLENPLGRSLRMGELTFTVIGVFKERVSTFGLTEIQKESVLIPNPLMKYYTGTDILRTIYVQAAHPEDVNSVSRQLTALLASRHPAGAVYDVNTLTAILTAAQNISRGLTIMLVVVAFIALLISGIGIMNIMLVTVKERTREIGIRKAVGAARQEIMYQFLVEAFLISGGGAVLGILIGIAIPVTAQMLLPGNLRVPISGGSVIVAFVVSCSTGLLFGYLPANQAAKLQPIESLRYE